jgi:hypothetical protein
MMQLYCKTVALHWRINIINLAIKINAIQNIIANKYFTCHDYWYLGLSGSWAAQEGKVFSVGRRKRERNGDTMKKGGKARRDGATTC